MNGLRLIREQFENVSPFITEADESNGRMYLKGVFAQAEKLNRNGRVYTKPILGKAVDTYITEEVMMKRALGETNHPAYPYPDPAMACIIVESLEWDGNDVCGSAKILRTPQGQLIEALVRDGVKLGVSTRALGSLKKGVFNNENVNFVNDDLSIKAVDVVTRPSGIDCFVDGILENVEYYYKNGVLTEREIDNFAQNIKNNDVNAIKADFKKFLSKI